MNPSNTWKAKHRDTEVYGPSTHDDKCKTLKGKKINVSESFRIFLTSLLRVSFLLWCKIP